MQQNHQSRTSKTYPPQAEKSAAAGAISNNCGCNTLTTAVVTPL